MTVEHTSPAEGLVVLQFDQGIGGLGDPESVGALPIRAFVVHPGAQSTSVQGSGALLV